MTDIKAAGLIEPYLLRKGKKKIVIIMGKYDLPEGSLISFMSNKVKKEGGINLAQGIPGFDPPPELLDSLESVVQKPVHQYAPGTGNNTLVDQLTDYYSKEGSFKRENLLVCTGATEAITLLYIYLSNIIKENYTVLAFDPAYESYKHLPRIFGQGYIPFPLEDYEHVDFEKLEKTIKTDNVKLVFITSPGNPLGKIWSRGEIEKLIDLSEKYGFYIIFDAVYKDLYFSEKPYMPFEHIGERLFYVNSFSKKYSITGWRIGYMITSAKHMEKIRSIHDYTHLSSPSPLQHAIALYNSKSNFGEDYLKKMRERLGNSFTLLKNALTGLGFSTAKAGGGYFIWTQLPEEFTDDFKFAVDLYENKKVAVIPGVHFTGKSRRFIRLNFARKEDELKEAIERLEEFCQNGKS